MKNQGTLFPTTLYNFDDKSLNVTAFQLDKLLSSNNLQLLTNILLKKLKKIRGCGINNRYFLDTNNLNCDIMI